MATTSSTIGNTGSAPPSPTMSQMPPMPSSPMYSMASTANPLSSYSLPLPPPPRPTHAVLTKADLEQSQKAYADLLTSAKAYRVALASLSTAASTFGSALEACARLKEARADSLGPPASAAPPMSNSFHAGSGSSCTADALLAASGVHHLIANHQQILSEAVYRAFEVPLLHELDKWRRDVEDEDEGYARAARAQGREIRRLEREGLKLHRQRRRDVARFRSHLVELTAQLDGLTSLHAGHARALLRDSQDASARIVDSSCSLVRAELDIFESLARKGWTGGGLEDLLERGVDLFAADDQASGAHGPGGPGGGGGGGRDAGAGDGSKLFSILPPRSILADSASDGTAVRPGHAGRADSLLVDADRYQSLAGAALSDTATTARDRDRDADSVFSEFNRPRGARPFSPQPQPIRLNPEGLIVAGLEENVAPTERAGGEAERDADEGDASRKESARLHPELEDEENDDEAHHPWRNEGLRKESEPESQEQRHAEDIYRASMDSTQRSRRWSITDDGVE